MQDVPPNLEKSVLGVTLMMERMELVLSVCQSMETNNVLNQTSKMLDAVLNVWDSPNVTTMENALVTKLALVMTNTLETNVNVYNVQNSMGSSVVEMELVDVMENVLVTRDSEEMIALAELVKENQDLALEMVNVTAMELALATKDGLTLFLNEKFAIVLLNVQPMILQKNVLDLEFVDVVLVNVKRIDEFFQIVHVLNLVHKLVTKINSVIVLDHVLVNLDSPEMIVKNGMIVSTITAKIVLLILIVDGVMKRISVNQDSTLFNAEPENKIHVVLHSERMLMNVPRNQLLMLIRPLKIKHKFYWRELSEVLVPRQLLCS